MKIVIAPDSFKGSVSAMDAAAAIDKGIKNAFPHAETVLMPVADGGEGTLETLIAATNGRKEHVKVTGPLGKEVDAHFGILGDKNTCVIEMAVASGLNLIKESERDPMLTTTYGTGELIKVALDQGYRNFVIAIGGSATNDGGVGMLQALGMEFKDKAGNEIGFGGGELRKIHHISIEQFDQRIKDSMFLIASDVENPLVGEKGASYVFGPQKGATTEMLETLDQNLLHYANLVENITGVRIHDMPGAGAAGGIGGAFLAFFPTDMKRGIEVVLENAKFAEALNGSDLVITGEGKVDFQTAYGKSPMGVAQAAQKKNVPTIILAGSVGDNIQNLFQYGVVGIFSIINQPMTLEKAMVEAERLLETSATQICRTYFWNEKLDEFSI
ncbi:glycerate kinase [Lederbergia citri]|uniref:Glycerate kinase n=1 Tax=Lederbergia citri TaxID=2833580 RepID=A0A942YKC0_9BACI|nr:glycerate kinase [Lederbergia citri]MBS4197196.1 glycerate kinase [Lederbergia citri]